MRDQSSVDLFHSICDKHLKSNSRIVAPSYTQSGEISSHLPLFKLKSCRHSATYITTSPTLPRSPAPKTPSQTRLHSLSMAAAVETPLTASDMSNGAQEGAVAQDGPITVFHDANNFNVKHPLANTWTLWFTKPPRGVCWRSPICMHCD